MDRRCRRATNTSRRDVGSYPRACAPQNETDHGVDERTFVALWSGDVDGNVSVRASDGEVAALRQLANGTDIPLNSPPRAVEQWNRGNLENFP